MNNEGMLSVVRSMMTDDDGTPLIGIEHGITAELVLNKMGIIKKNTDPYTYSKKHNHAGVTCNEVMIEYQKYGYVAGGMSRAPTYFFIARKDNKREEGLILYKKIKNTNGRMKVIVRVGKSFIDSKKISPTIRMFDKIARSLESEQALEE